MVREIIVNKRDEAIDEIISRMATISDLGLYRLAERALYLFEIHPLKVEPCQVFRFPAKKRQARAKKAASAV